MMKGLLSPPKTTMANPRPPAKPIRKAATVVVVRPAGPADIEVFMVQRPDRGAFPNLHVFPGGKMDGADADLSPLCRDLSDAAASASLGLESGGLRYWVTAIRECFEECGVLLAYRGDRLFEPRDALEEERFHGYRDALVNGELSWLQLVHDEGLQLATDRMRYFSHWVTPECAPARFDTRFFVAAMPPGQRAVGHHEETAGGVWVRPADALRHHDEGRWQMIRPTLITLGTAARYASVETLLAAVAAGAHLPSADDALYEQGLQRDSAIAAPAS